MFLSLEKAQQVRLGTHWNGRSKATSKSCAVSSTSTVSTVSELATAGTGYVVSPSERVASAEQQRYRRSNDTVRKYSTESSSDQTKNTASHSATREEKTHQARVDSKIDYSWNSKLSLRECTSGSASAYPRVKLLKCAYWDYTFQIHIARIWFHFKRVADPWQNRYNYLSLSKQWQCKCQHERNCSVYSAESPTSNSAAAQSCSNSV